MLLIPNLFLNTEEQTKLEHYIKKDHSKFSAILYLVNIKPFINETLDINVYRSYTLFVEKLSKQFQLPVVGFFDDRMLNPYDVDFSSQLKIFQHELVRIMKQGITTFIRNPRLKHIPFTLLFENVCVGVLQESPMKILNRIYSKELFFAHLNYLSHPIRMPSNKPMSVTSKYYKRFSIAHPDNTNFGDIFYHAVKNSTDKLRTEIDDIYFAREFIYDDGITYFKYGNVMGVNASDEQLDYLFAIQKEFGISISLTLNSMDYDPQILLNPKILKAFVMWLKSLYERGLRVCTISNTHLMKSGILHREFPQMKWKNTVNHKITDAQSFLNYAHLGYDFIQLDRSLARNITELEKISIVNKKFKSPKKLYLLASEFCAYECPFKIEHDVFNENLGNATRYFSTQTKLSHISCDNWRTAHTSSLPRLGVDIFFYDETIIDTYLQFVDVFKISGRLNNFDILNNEKHSIRLSALDDEHVSFADAVHSQKLAGKLIGYKLLRPQYNHLSFDGDSLHQILTSREGKKLLNHLLDCKNQCYDCHLCEKVFHLTPFDSLLQLKNNFQKHT